jgi:hypothetical protein
MIGILESILCAIEEVAAGVVGLFVVMLNAMIVGLGALLGVIVGLLPNMPAPPAAPSSGVLGLINFFVPLAPLAVLLTTMSTLFVGFLAVKVILNWLRAL